MYVYTRLQVHFSYYDFLLLRILKGVNCKICLEVLSMNTSALFTRRRCKDALLEIHQAYKNCFRFVI